MQFPKSSPPVEILCQLTRLFENLSASGYKTSSPDILARIFIGSIHHFAFSSLKGMNKHCPCDKKIYITELVGVILNSMEKMDV